jgi:predicted negative regulator of RcsB-dependent stress response
MQSEPARSHRFYEILAWVEVNRKKLAIAAIIGLALTLVLAIYKWHQGERESKASQALTNLRPPGLVSSNAPSARAEDFLKLADEYRDTQAAERAWLIGAGSLFADGKFTEAQTQFEKFLNDYSKSPWTAQAFFGIAAALDAQNRVDDALAKYQEVITRYPGNSIADQARFSLGRLYEYKNQPRQALASYDEIMRGKASGAWSFAARQQRELLLQKHPELALSQPPGSILSSNLGKGLTNLMLRVPTNRLINTQALLRTNPISGTNATTLNTNKP